MRTWTWRRTYSSTGLHSEVGASDTCRKRASTSFMVFRPYFEVFAAYPGVPETALRLGPGLHLPGVAVEVARLPRGQQPISEPYHTHHAQLTSLHVNLHDLSIYLFFCACVLNTFSLEALTKNTLFQPFRVPPAPALAFCCVGRSSGLGIHSRASSWGPGEERRNARFGSSGPSVQDFGWVLRRLASRLNS